MTVSTSDEGTSFYVPVDRPREPSPELRERVAKAIERAYNEFDLSAFSKLDDRFWPEAADAVLAALREEQGR